MTGLGWDDRTAHPPDQAEALVHWTHPDLGEVSPAEFIPLAELCGLIFPISQWGKYGSLHDAHSWMVPGLIPLTVSVNISALQFDRGDLVSMVLHGDGTASR